MSLYIIFRHWIILFISISSWKSFLFSASTTFDVRWKNIKIAKIIILFTRWSIFTNCILIASLRTLKVHLWRAYQLIPINIYFFIRTTVIICLFWTYIILLRWSRKLKLLFLFFAWTLGWKILDHWRGRSLVLWKLSLPIRIMTFISLFNSKKILNWTLNLLFLLWKIRSHFFYLFFIMDSWTF